MTVKKKYLPKRLLNLCSLLSVARVRIIKWIPKYDEDRLMTAHNCDFIADSLFIRCYDSATKLGLTAGKKSRWSTYVACWAADRAKNLGGDFIDCSENVGFLSRAVMEYVDFKTCQEKYYLIDVFTSQGDESRDEQVKRAFNEFRNVSIVKGALPGAFAEVTATKIAYLHIDMDSTSSEISAAEYFWNKLVSGAAVILDNYGHSEEEKKKIFDDFAKRKNVPLLCLPTGQGLILKS